MNKALATLLLLLSFAGLAAAEAGKPLKSVDVDVFDLESVRRGAGYFSNYCLGCHGVKQMRYSRVAADLGLDVDTMRQEIMFGDVKIHDYMKTAIAPTDAEMTFGVVPPDLSLIVRARGADWIYTYLKSFYEDPKRPFGVNNLLVENVAMPNVLWEMQGTQSPVVREAGGKEQIVDVKRDNNGKLSGREFNKVLVDLTNFLAYTAEPTKLERLPLGKYVIVFLIFLTVILYKLKKEYWKDVD
jgi:ubiquinol-cytochrome c reductase cytochrome c1 subunit